MSETKLILHKQSPTDLVTHAYSIQRVDDRGVPIGVVCLFDVPPDPSDNYRNEDAAARAIFDAVNRAASPADAGLVEEAMKALRGLSADVRGVLSFHEFAIREVIGSTNYAVILDKLTEADALIARAKGATHG